MVKICQFCCMDTSAVEITFDEKGTCNFCTDWFIREKQRKIDKQELPWIIYAIKKAGKGKEFDCLLGLSGGVDSSLCLVYLLEQGLRPFCFSVENGYQTPEAQENIMRMVEGLKVPYYRYNIDLEEFKAVQKAFEESKTLNIEIPSDHLIMATTYEMARKYGIKWIIGGGNHATEGIMPASFGYNAKDLTFLKAVYGKPIKNLPTISLLQYIWYRFVNKVKIVNLLDFYEYNREKAKKLLTERFGWKDYGDKHCESSYTKWFQEEYLPRFGIIKDKAHYSTLICSGQMTRDEALKKLEGREIGDEKSVSHLRFRNSEHHWEMLASIYKKWFKL